MKRQSQFNSRGFSLDRDTKTGKWVASASDVEGWGKTRAAAVQAALNNRRVFAEDDEIMRREEREDLVGSAQRRSEREAMECCDCAQCRS